MKHLIFLTITVAFVLGGCSGGDTADTSKIEAAARRDAMKVAEAPEGSMQREHAVIEIRVREERLRQAGHDQAADIYIQEAEHMLIDSLHIISPRASDPVTI